MLANSISIGMSAEELATVDRERGNKTRAQHTRDNAMAYKPEEVAMIPSVEKGANLKTSLYPIEEYIVKRKVDDSGIDFGKATKAQNWHSFLRCVAQMPARTYNRKDIEEHYDWQKLIDEGVMKEEEVARMVEALA